MIKRPQSYSGTARTTSPSGMWTSRSVCSGRSGTRRIRQPGTWGFILDQLPSDVGNSCCQFLFEDGSSFALFTMEMAPAFFDEYQDYQDEGCSVRGSKEKILAEIAEQLQEQARQWTLAM